MDLDILYDLSIFKMDLASIRLGIIQQNVNHVKRYLITCVCCGEPKDRKDLMIQIQSVCQSANRHGAK